MKKNFGFMYGPIGRGKNTSYQWVLINLWISLLLSTMIRAIHYPSGRFCIRTRKTLPTENCMWSTCSRMGWSTDRTIHGGEYISMRLSPRFIRLFMVRILLH
jgi:hypothetical protein